MLCLFLVEPAVINGPAEQLLSQIGAKNRRDKDTRMLFSLIYFFAPFSIFYIPHNYVIPQAMPHAIQQTHSAVYPLLYRLTLLVIKSCKAFTQSREDDKIL